MKKRKVREMKKLAVIILIFAVSYPMLQAALPANAAEKEIRLLILHSLSAKEQDDEVYMLDMLAGHFTDSATIMSLEDALKKRDEEKYTHMIYLRLDTDAPEMPELSLINSFQGSLYLIGNRLDAFGVSDGMEIKEYIEIDRIYKDEEAFGLDNAKSVMMFDAYEDATVYFQGNADGHLFPLIFEKNETFYAATQSITGEFTEFLGESLFDFFEKERGKPQKFLRLEDIHPKYDPAALQEIGDYLAELGIPYAITVIPVYTNPETGERISLSESDELVEVLQNMQKQGASIILHGYYHQYRDSETGEGSEYWDMENDRPIYQAKNDPVFKREDFASDQEYREFLKKGARFEERYIADTIERGIFDLVNEGLYPVAFEAPHYAISQAGYQVVSDYFSTYVGQVQISDETYEASFTPVFTSTPSKLSGMQVIPEGMGYIEADNPESVGNMMKRAERISVFSDSKLSFFFHPYIGIKKFKEVMEGMEKYEEYGWFDLRSMNNKAAAEGIAIQTTGGAVKADRSINTIIKQEFENLWGFAIPVFVVVLILLLSMNGIRKKKKAERFSAKPE